MPGITGAVLGVVCVQMYLLLDCVDGEIARWKKQYSLGGVYLDRVGAYLTDAAVLVGFGLRAADLWGTGRIDWLWAFLGTLAALGAILIKAETDLVGVARHQGGLPPVKESASNRVPPGWRWPAGQPRRSSSTGWSSASRRPC